MTSRADQARGDPDTSVVRSRQTCRPFLAAIARLRSGWATKVINQIAAHTGYHPRSVQRWMAGHGTPDADVGYALIRTDRGPSIVEAIAADMPAGERAKFWNEMGKVARRQKLLAERDRILAEIEAAD